MLCKMLVPHSASHLRPRGEHSGTWEQGRDALHDQGQDALQPTASGWEPGFVYMVRRGGMLVVFAGSLALFCVATVNSRRASQAQDTAQIRLAIQNALESAHPIREGAVLAQSEAPAERGTVAPAITEEPQGPSE